MHDSAQALRGKKLLLVGFTLFSMFFGAGNLIFPPFLGAQAGTALWSAFAGFAVSAIGLPIAGVAAVARAGGLPAVVGGQSAASGRAVGAGVGAVLGSLCRRAARTRTALPRPAAAGGLVLRRVPGASCPADAGIPAVCAGARPAAGRDVPGVSRRQLCAGGGADGGKPPAWQGHKKAGIKIKDA